MSPVSDFQQQQWRSDVRKNLDTALNEDDIGKKSVALTAAKCVSTIIMAERIGQLAEAIVNHPGSTEDLDQIYAALDKGSRAVLDPNDLQVDVFRSGRGGVQNGPDAVRITHTPTGLVETVERDAVLRSELMLKEEAMSRLSRRVVQHNAELAAQTLAAVVNDGPDEEPAETATA